MTAEPPAPNSLRRSSGTPGIDYVSPLPPVRSGIADYSADLLPHLSRYLDIRVARLPEQPVAPEIEQRYAPVAADRLAEGGRVPLYQMGNNPHHEAVWDLAMERPGLVTLHDLVLHHLLQHRTLGKGIFEPYYAALSEDHGWVGAAVSHPWHWGIETQAALFSLAAHRSLLTRQLGVLVHSQWARDRVREENPEVRVEAVPMAIPLPAAADEEAGRALRRRHGIPDGAPLLGSFGFQTPIKRTDAALRALSEPALSEAHLVIVGEASPKLDLEGEARRAGLADRVHVLGFVDYGEFEAWVAAVDLCLNLRYPTAGETSASLLRVLSAGRPAVVSDYAQFADLPEEVAVRVPLGEGEAECLALEVGALLADRSRLAAMSHASRKHVAAHHHPARAARVMAETVRGILAEEKRPTPREPVAWARRPPSSLTWTDLRGVIEVEGAQAPWPEGERRRLTVRLENRGTARWLPASAGPGGMALEVAVAGGEPLRVPWHPLRREIPPGGTARIEVDLRRPLRAERLVLATRVLGGPGARTASWEGRFE